MTVYQLYTGVTLVDHWFVCLLLNRVHRLHLLYHSGNQWCSHFCITHYCGWVDGHAVDFGVRQYLFSILYKIIVIVEFRHPLGVSPQGTLSQWTCVPFTTTTASSGTPCHCWDTVSTATCWGTARGTGGWVRLATIWQVRARRCSSG